MVGSRLAQSLGHVRGVHSKAVQDADRDAVARAKQRAEHVLAPDRLGAEALALAQDALGDPGGARRERKPGVPEVVLARPPRSS
jgi:hypothetical protein